MILELRVVAKPMGMRHVKDESGKGATDDYVHYEGCGLIGSHTLCGWTDITGADFEDTNKRVNCRGCLAVRDHVLGR